MGKVEVYCGDCVELVPQLGQFDFVFADPPFNIGQEYRGYADFMPWDEYAQFTDNWTSACWTACEGRRSGGVMALHGPDNVAALFLQHGTSYGPCRVAWINWHYRFGQCHRSNWIDARCHCLIFARQGYTWNPDAVLVESDRATTYNDVRISDTANGGKRLPGTVWGVPSDGPYWGRVQGNNSERREGHPNQLPEVYLERLILAYTNPGDRVLDPFGGSGTTAVVAAALGRNCVTIDISAENCASIADRVRQGAVRVRAK